MGVLLDPGRPIGRAAVDAAMAVGSQAALAIDNARLYQQQKEFAETMQRSLLPREPQRVPGLEIDTSTSRPRESSAATSTTSSSSRTGGSRLSSADNPGKGISAAADMAMAKYLFRVLARADADPATFLRSANEVACDELEQEARDALYALVDSGTGQVASASAGHPPRPSRRSARPRHAAGRNRPPARHRARPGLRGRARLRLEPGSVVVLYTDGVIEARRDGELYGEERLDRLLAEARAPRRGARCRDPGRLSRVCEPAASSTTTARSSVSSWHAGVA